MSRMADAYLDIAYRSGLDPEQDATLDTVARALDAVAGDERDIRDAAVSHIVGERQSTAECDIAPQKR